MQHFHKQQFGTRLLALGLSVGLVLGSLTGCGNQGQDTGSSDTLVTSTDSASAGVTNITTFPLPEVPEESTIFVEPVDGISDDFYRGMDASAVLALENSGVKYYNFDGEKQDVFMTLAQAGVNYIRLRVWNDPYDENGNGYGGGNNDVATAIALGQRATKYGMKVCIDFHYSDFWADPKKQFVPKAWEGMDIEEKSDALYNFTLESLTQLLDAGVDVGMVQIGNEINNGMSGETDVANVRKLLTAGSKAVREAAVNSGKEILVAVHYTNIDDMKKLDTLLTGLQVKEIDYDIVGLSFYPYWHGTMDDLKNAITHIRNTYGKKVYVAENAYCYTAEDGDGSANSVEGTDDLAEGYSASVQGQANEVRDVCAAASEAGAEGVFYWEGTWIPVGPADADNSDLWEKYGSGWASSYASGYDPKDAGQYYGGCSWDNQAMFDFTGHPLASLNVFKYLKYGATAPLAVDSIPEVTVACNIGTDPELPDTVSVIYNDRSEAQVPVIWNTDDVAAIDTKNGGNFTVSGTLDDGTEVTAAVTVDRINYVQNPSFEDSDTSMWTINYSGETDPTDYQVKAADAHSGEVAFHFWSGSADMDFSIEQSFTDLEPGTYELSAFSQGGDLSDDASMELYAMVDGKELTAPFKLTTYADWQNPTVSEIKVTDGSLTIGVRYKCNVNSWGTLDDVTLYKIAE
ncbi:glycosyl hydrolase family 53 [Firmicutes bacterium AM59-13]|jgi:arabinogalactan endo-1,4-beta-galactosidase|nr:glycosyl hydrolase family 53 [Firmicutes bacterium AM59-13]